MANEKRLIDYERAKAIALNILRGKITTVTAVKLVTSLKYATVDAVEVVHGHWEYGKWENGHWVKGNERCHCSVCHRDFAVDNLNIWHGCPQCLAKMDGGNEDG